MPAIEAKSRSLFLCLNPLLDPATTSPAARGVFTAALLTWTGVPVIALGLFSLAIARSVACESGGDRNRRRSQSSGARSASTASTSLLASVDEEHGCDLQRLATKEKLMRPLVVVAWTATALALTASALNGVFVQHRRTHIKTVVVAIITLQIVIMFLLLYLTRLVCIHLDVLLPREKDTRAREVTFLRRRLSSAEADVRTLQEAWSIAPHDLQLRAFVAQGAEGKVYRAVWRRSIEVAVKFILRDPQDKTRWGFSNAEVKAMQRLRGSRLLHFYGVGVCCFCAPDDDKKGGDDDSSDGREDSGSKSPFNLTPAGELTEPLLGTAGGRARGRTRTPPPPRVRPAGPGDDKVFDFVVTEYCAAGSLASLLKAKQTAAWPWRERLRVLLDVAEGMAQMHDRRYVHRDLKPDNVLIDGEGRAKVADLGLARHHRGFDARAARSLRQRRALDAELTLSHVTAGGTPPCTYRCGYERPTTPILTLGSSLAISSRRHVPGLDPELPAPRGARLQHLRSDEGEQRERERGRRQRERERRPCGHRQRRQQRRGGGGTARTRARVWRRAGGGGGRRVRVGRERVQLAAHPGPHRQRR